MNITDLTIGQAREIMRMFGGTEDDVPKTRNYSLIRGEKYLIRTVTMMYTGKIESITDTDIVLSDAAWIADSGRYADALTDGTLNEVEPYPDSVIVSRAVIVDAAPWSHPLPREQK